VNSFAEGDERMAMLMGAKRFTKTGSFNSTTARRLVAKKMIEAGKLPYRGSAGGSSGITHENEQGRC